jgi:hypothetical protein
VPLEQARPFSTYRDILTDNTPMLDRLQEKGFTIQFESHAAAVLGGDFPEALSDLETALADLEVPIVEIIGSGGGESKGTQRMRHSLAAVGWHKINFEITKTINGVPRESRSHEVDHVKQFKNGYVALEIEWNNKDPFFDRDLENFKRLQAEGAISVGIIVTRAVSLHESMHGFVLRFARENRLQSLDDLGHIGLSPTRRQRTGINKRVNRLRNPIDFPTAWTDQFIADKYGEATTHWRKLLDRVNRGVGNPCPLLLVGLPASIVRFESASPESTAAALEEAAIQSEEDSDAAE